MGDDGEERKRDRFRDEEERAISPFPSLLLSSRKPISTSSRVGKLTFIRSLSKLDEDGTP